MKILSMSPIKGMRELTKLFPARKTRKIIPNLLKPLSLLFVVLLIAAGCGYHNPNMLPPEKQGRALKLHVPIWPNPTNEIRLASDIHNALQDWLGQSKQFTLVNSSGEADYVVNGKINAVSFTGRDYDATDRAQALIATLNVDYTITDTRTGKAAWEAKGFVLTESYALLSDTNKRQALETLVDHLAEQIYIRLYSAITRHEKNTSRVN